MRKDPSSLGGP